MKIKWFCELYSWLDFELAGRNDFGREISLQTRQRRFPSELWSRLEFPDNICPKAKPHIRPLFWSRAKLKPQAEMFYKCYREREIPTSLEEEWANLWRYFWECQNPMQHISKVRIEDSQCNFNVFSATYLLRCVARSLFHIGSTFIFWRASIWTSKIDIAFRFLYGNISTRKDQILYPVQQNMTLGQRGHEIRQHCAETACLRFVEEKVKFDHRNSFEKAELTFQWRKAYIEKYRSHFEMYGGVGNGMQHLTNTAHWNFI